MKGVRTSVSVSCCGYMGVVILDVRLDMGLDVIWLARMATARIYMKSGVG